MAFLFSKTTTDIVTEALSKISNEIYNKISNNGTQSIIIKNKNVDGDVIISNNESNQSGKVDMYAIFNTFNDNNIASKLNSAIEQSSKSTIDGLNLLQINANVSTLNSIIKNTINITNKGISECKNTFNQYYSVTNENVKGNVIYESNIVNQTLESVASCIVKNGNVSSLVSETDSKIRQLSSTSIEGLDIKWIAIIGMLFVGGFGFVGIPLLSSFLGPGLLVIGSGLMFYVYNKAQSVDTEATITYIISNLPKNNVNIMESDVIGIVDFNKEEQYPEAELYELFRNKVTLYKSSGDKSKLRTLKDTVTKDNLQVLKQDEDGLKIYYIIPTSEKYGKKSELFDLSDFTKEIKLIMKKEDGISYVNNDENTIIWDYNQYIHQILVYIVKKTNTKDGLELVLNIDVDPTIIKFKNKRNLTLKDLFKNTLFLVGVGMFVCGLIITVLKFTSRNNASEELKK